MIQKHRPLNTKHQKVVELWNQNLTGTEIAKEMGLTRNAVLGLIFRLRSRGDVELRHDIPVELRKPQPPREPKPKIEKPKKVKRENVVVFKPREVSLPKFRPDPAQIVMEFVMPANPITLMELGPNSCRYILSVDTPVGAVYCGEPKAIKSYCMHHASLCYYKPKDNKNENLSNLRSYAPKRRWNPYLSKVSNAH